MKIKKGDQIEIIAGKDRGKRGKVISVLPAEDRVVVEGLNLRKKHLRSKKQGTPGERVEIPAPLHVSNVMLVCPHSGRPTRVGYAVSGEAKTRVSKRSGKEI